jgi:hypothetical protein
MSLDPIRSTHAAIGSLVMAILLLLTPMFAAHAESTGPAQPAKSGRFDWTKVPPVSPMPRLGSFIVPPSGPGYYSLWDHLTDVERKAPPISPYAPFGLFPPSSFDVDFRYLDKPDAEKSFFDPIKRIHLRDDWLLSFGGNFWVRNVHEWESRLGEQDNVFNLTRLRLYSDVWYQDRFRIFAEFLDARSFDQDLPRLPIDENRHDLLNLLADIKLADIADGPAYVRVGRQELLYGSQRLISTLDWANTRRTFQGVKTFWDSPQFDIDAFWVRPMLIDVNEFDARPDRWDEDQNFYGLWGTYKPMKGHFADLYFLSLDTNPRAASQKGGALVDSVLHTIGARYAGNYKQVLFELEGMYQFGARARAKQDISAGAVAAGLGYHFASLPMNPQMWLRYDYASGDDNPHDGTWSTFNQLFPFGHYYFGFLDRVGRQNINDFNVQLVLYPQPWFTVIVQYHKFWLANKKDFLYNAAGVATRRDPTGRAGDDVGDELDLRFNVHLSHHQDLMFGYSKLWSGDFIKKTGPNVSPDFFYMQHVFRF